MVEEVQVEVPLVNGQRCHGGCGGQSKGEKAQPGPPPLKVEAFTSVFSQKGASSLPVSDNRTLGMEPLLLLR
jgi:hypothetical protein